MRERRNQVSSPSSTERSIITSSGVVPRSAAISPSRRPSSARFLSCATLRTSVLSQSRPAAAAISGGSVASAISRRFSSGSRNAASLSAQLASDTTVYQLGRVMKSRLRCESVKLMSIGRVCTCGQTRAPRAHCSPTRARTRSPMSGKARLWKRGENVVGMPCRSESSASWSTRERVSSVSKNSCTAWSILPRSPSTAASAASSLLCA